MIVVVFAGIVLVSIVLAAVSSVIIVISIVFAIFALVFAVVGIVTLFAYDNYNKNNFVVFLCLFPFRLIILLFIVIII